MPIDIWSIPHDARTGLVAGSYYLLHSSIGNGGIGPVMFENGRSARALTGRELKQIVSAIGRDVDIEPADDEARAAWAAKHAEPARVAPERGTPAVSVDEAVIIRAAQIEGQNLPRHADPAERHAPKPPVTMPAPAAVDLDKIEDIEALRAIATGLYVDVDAKWNTRRLRTEIRRARGE